MSADSTSALKGRTLVLCFDGTSNQYDGDNTNVVKFYSLLKKDATDQQLCYYQPGVGTYFQPGVVAPLFQWCAKMLDMAVAWYLDAHVRGGYAFLMQNWRPGDKICIFGFSRGAYTARALAGFIHKIGLLPKDNPEQVPLAYRMFKKTDTASIQLAAGFKQTFCRSVQIEFVGVWDTVASVGLLMSKSLPFTTTNTTIRTFRHALSLDEHRAKFQPNLYHRLSPDATRTVHDLQAELGIDQTNGPGTDSTPSPVSDLGKDLPVPHKSSSQAAENLRRQDHKVKHADLSAVTDPSDDFVGLTDVLEVWFAGCHADVGGGSTPNSTVHALSDISLRWMVRQVVQAQCGIQFDNEAIARAGIPASAILGSVSTGTDIDAVQPINDELKLNPAWWLLEVIPTSYTYQDGKGFWHTKWGFHLGKGRQIPDMQPKFHESVKERMEDKTLKYTPRATWRANTECYVS
ncbi:hypothetical protein BC835DRAFT_1263977 [Cytidiella melzeri]|nr:hypothetical protein BC835DRAFT_1263977 [Cytidiella melzeri]